MYTFSGKRFLRRFATIQKKYDIVLIGIVSVLVICGLTFFASSISIEQPAEFYKKFLTQLIFGVWIGGFLAFILSKIDYHELFKIKGKLIGVTIGLLSVLALLAGFMSLMGMGDLQKKAFIDRLENPIAAPAISKGALRWIEVGFITIQPSELVKLTLLIYFAAVINSLKNEEITILKLKKPIYLFFLVSSLIIIQPDLGSIMILFGILLSAMWISKVPNKILLTIVGIVCIFAAISIVTTPYRRGRFNVAYNKSEASDAQIYQTQNAQKAIINGGLWGLGYGNSEAKQKGTIPESSNDAIIGIIGEEMGFVVTTLFLSIYIVFCFRGLKIAKEAPDAGGRALATGITFWIMAHVFLNIGGILGVLPLKGLPLPFVSEGGTSMVLNLASIGILLNISSHKTGGEGLTSRKEKPVFAVRKLRKQR
jgi:cell division protein FtsW (lipid II flippase)